MTHSALTAPCTQLINAEGCSGVLAGTHEFLWVILNDPEWSSSWFSNKRKMLIFKRTSFYYFGNILVKISLNHNKLESFKIYIERTVEKCPRWNFKVLWRLRNEQKKSGNNIAGHPVWGMLQPFINQEPQDDRRWYKQWFRRLAVKTVYFWVEWRTCQWWSFQSLSRRWTDCITQPL